MEQKQSWGDFPPYRKASLPAFPGLISVLGPGVIFMALAQGSGELIWWLYIIAKYELTFLADTWLAIVAAVSRIHTDCIYAFSRRARIIPVRSWCFFFILLLTVVTSITVLLDEPGPLILFSAVIGFVGTVLFSVALIFLNHIALPRHLPHEARPGRLSLFFLVLSSWPTVPWPSPIFRQEFG